MTNTIENFLNSKKEFKTIYAYADYLPSQEKEDLLCFVEDVNDDSVITTSDGEGTLYVDTAIDYIKSELEDQEDEEPITFLKTVLSILEKCKEANIDIIKI